jgi:hypothetical protein
MERAGGIDGIRTGVWGVTLGWAAASICRDADWYLCHLLAAQSLSKTFSKLACKVALGLPVVAA